MATRRGPTLGQTFALGGLALASLLALLFYVVLERSRTSTLEVAERLRSDAANEIEARVSAFLDQAEEAAREVELAVRNQVVYLGDELSIETTLFQQLLASPDLAEVTLTYGHLAGRDERGYPVLEDRGRGQVSVFRAGDADYRIDTRKVSTDDVGGLVAVRRERGPGDGLYSPDFLPEPEGAAVDPTDHATFRAPAREKNLGRPLWSDLHWTQLDGHLEPAERRVVVSLQRSIEAGGDGRLFVLRVALLVHRLDAVTWPERGSEGEPHRVFLCDDRGRLITRLTGDETIRASDGDLRVDADPAPEIAAALARPELAEVLPVDPWRAGRFESGNVDYLFTFRALPDSQDWIVGVVVPEAHYLGELERIRAGLLAITAVVILVILVANTVMLRLLRRGLGSVDERSASLERFDFEPRPVRAGFRDVAAVLERLEVAKTAMRALGHYVAVDLVRQLYRDRREPTLGAEPREITLMFSDIEGFTTISEELPPDELADRLGHYLVAMTEGIHGTRGVIDKFIGDAVMALWNAPTELDDHPIRACEGALACVERTRLLFESASWRGRPPFVTRFGIHTATVLVGHFGAPSRMSYTALGDGVNLAARLEGLNKFYGTRILVGEPVVEAARGRFEFRLVDLVAVKGKREGVRIYELLGERGGDAARFARAQMYERAFEAYLARDFAGALAGLSELEGDGPADVLRRRCQALLDRPPDDDWAGVFAHTSK